MSRPGMHMDLFTNVALHEDGTVAGEKRTRGIGVGATAATRTQQADGRHVTQHTLHRAGFMQRFVHVLPLKAVHVDTLQCIRRIVWRVQHLALVAELDGLQALVPDVNWLPPDAVRVPLPILAASLTHKGASAEPLGPLPARSEGSTMTRDAALINKEGCTDYEVLEWAGDAVLDLLSKSCVMASHPQEEVGRLQERAELLFNNKPLWRRAKALS
eukprot:2448736-Prymnesium_polylepis.1